MSGPAREVILIVYTTLYRDGGPELERAARTLARDKRALHPAGDPGVSADADAGAGGAVEVRCVRIESKAELLQAIAAVATDKKLVRELHFVGHSGMYGPMYKTTAMPEQMSPHEWRELHIPFAPGASAWFHACRTARWFAPFFARTFGVPTHGYHWYTTFSARPDRFVWAGPPKGGGRLGRLGQLARRLRGADDAPLYLIGCRGKKSDGLVGSLLKYTGLIEAEVMKRFEPRAVEGDPSYDAVAELYDEVFTDIRVRKPEWAWLSEHLPSRNGLRVLDVGCGNGALLQAIRPRLGPDGRGVGVDASAGMIACAERRERALASPSAAPLSFHTIDGPRLPLPDQSVDLVVSLLSFRYLDWDPIMHEIRRVLAPGGRILIVDMVTVPLAPGEWPTAVAHAARAALERRKNPAFGKALARLTRDPRWATMLAYNPIRAQHEYVWYLESRFPGRKVETLDIGWHNRVLAFDSGPLEPGTVAPLSYP